MPTRKVKMASGRQLNVVGDDFELTIDGREFEFFLHPNVTEAGWSVSHRDSGLRVLKLAADTPVRDVTGAKRQLLEYFEKIGTARVRAVLSGVSK